MQVSRARSHVRGRLNRGRYAQAIAAFEQSLTYHRKRSPLPQYTIANVLNALAAAHGALGDDVRVIRLLDEAKDLATAALGKDHPFVAMLWANRVGPLYYLGRSEEAAAAANIAVEIYERAEGGKGIALAYALEQLAATHVLNGRYDALALLERARSI